MVQLKINVHEHRTCIGFYIFMYVHEMDIHALVRSLLLQRERGKKIVYAAIKIYSHSSALILNLHLRERIQVKLETSARSIKIKFYDLELYLKIIYFYLCIVQSRKEEN